MTYTRLDDTGKLTWLHAIGHFTFHTPISSFNHTELKKTSELIVSYESDQSRLTSLHCGSGNYLHTVSGRSEHWSQFD